MKKLLLTCLTALVCLVSLAQAHMPGEEEWTQNIEQWQERMRVMQQQMAKIAKEEDPQERQKLLAEHWQGWTHDGWTHDGWTHDGWTHDGWSHDGWSHDGAMHERRHDGLRIRPSYDAGDDASPHNDDARWRVG
jgi:hypothetical protein